MSNDDPRYPGDEQNRPPSAPQYGANSQPGQAPQYGANSQPGQAPQYGAYRQPDEAPQGYPGAGQAPVGYPQDAPQSGYATGGYAPTQQLSAGLAIAALVCGILALVGGFFVLPALLGLVAVILGFVALSKIKRGTARGKGMAIAGIITGILSIILAGVLVAVGFAAFQQAGGANLIDCLQQAGNDQAKAQQCQEQFASRVTSTTAN